jgi:hypothetical protein
MPCDMTETDRRFRWPRWSRRPQQAPFTALLTSLLLTLAAGAAQANVYRCSGADGKVVFSDKPCPAGQSGATVRIAPSPPAAPSPAARPQGLAPDTGAAARKAAADRIAAALSPECRVLTERVRNFTFEGAGAMSEAEARELFERTERECGDALRRAVEAEHARAAAARQAEARRAECAAQRRVLDERRPRLASLPPSDRAAFEQLEREVARDCR